MHILNYINEGNNVTNVFEMKDALESNGGVRKTFTSIIDVDMSTQPVLSGQLQIPISQYNNLWTVVLWHSSLTVFESSLFHPKSLKVLQKKHSGHPRSYRKILISKV